MSVMCLGVFSAINRYAKVCHCSVLVVFLCVLFFPHPVQSQVLKPRFTDSKSFVQIFCVTALLGDSSMIQIQFALTNLGISNKTGANKILYISDASKSSVYK